MATTGHSLDSMTFVLEFAVGISVKATYLFLSLLHRSTCILYVRDLGFHIIAIPATELD